jgi:hypothetical protein
MIEGINSQVTIDKNALLLANGLAEKMRRQKEKQCFSGVSFPYNVS